MLRRTKILATIGPVSRHQVVIRSLIEAGADAFRLNFSYGSQEEHAEAAAIIRGASGQLGRPIAILQDLQGPKIRVGQLANGPYELTAGAEVTITTRAVTGNAAQIPIDEYPLLREVRPGDGILLGDGELELRVIAVGDGELRARVLNDGILKENQGFHLPGVKLSAEAITEKDVADLKFGLRLGVEYVALSFVRGGEDIRRLRGLMEAEGARLPIIAKLEKREAIENLNDIVAEADGVMVARGDLALEVSPEKVPLLQKRIIRQANERGILVITATQMLESMVNNPRPTRAEASDVANAILDGTDVAMLSAETAVGRYPGETVRMMARIAEEAEREPVAAHAERQRPTHSHAMARAACALAADVKAAAIVVFTRTGYSAHLVALERPGVPIFAFTPSEEVCRQLALWWGVTSLLADFPEAVEEMIVQAGRHLVQQGLLQRGDTAVVARWAPLRTRGWYNFVNVYRMGGAR